MAGNKDKGPKIDKETKELLYSMGVSPAEMLGAKKFVKKGGTIEGWIDKKASKGLYKKGFQRIKAALAAGPEGIAAQQQRVVENRARQARVQGAIANTQNLMAQNRNNQAAIAAGGVPTYHQPVTNAAGAIQADQRNFRDKLNVGYNTPAARQIGASATMNSVYQGQQRAANAYGGVSGSAAPAGGWVANQRKIDAAKKYRKKKKKKN